jgi:hypothetical protein
MSFGTSCLSENESMLVGNHRSPLSLPLGGILQTLRSVVDFYCMCIGQRSVASFLPSRASSGLLTPRNGTISGKAGYTQLRFISATIFLMVAVDAFVASDRVVCGKRIGRR